MKPLKQIAEENGVSYNTLRDRAKKRNLGSKPYGRQRLLTPEEEEAVLVKGVQGWKPGRLRGKKA